MRITKAYCFLVLICLLIACNSDIKKNDVLLAKVYKAELYQSDVDEFLKEDSVAFNQRRYIDSWVRNELFVSKAQLAKSDLKEIEQLTKSFEKTLVIQKQKERYLRKNLDTKVEANELSSAYQELKDNYKLKKDIFKYHLVVVEKNRMNVLDIKNFFKRKDFDQFYESLNTASDQIFLDSTSWHNWFDISLQLPVNEIEEDDIEENVSEIIESTDHIFFLRVFDFIDKSETAPLSYMKRYLENAIIEKRKEKLIQDYSNELYQSALNNNKIIIN